MTKLRSMTGRGCGTAEGPMGRVDVELSSVNRKQLDVNLCLPRPLASLEAPIQKKIQARVLRGRIGGEIRVTWATGQAGKVRVDLDRAQNALNALRSVSKQYDLRDDLTLSTLLSLPDVLVFEQRPQDVEALWPVTAQALDAALDKLLAMRETEGDALRLDLLARLQTLEEMLNRIGECAPQVVATYRENLLRRLSGVLKGTPLEEDERVLKEIALFADRADITEERVRLASHLAQAKALLTAGGVAGRTLDFLVQEAGREINTIGSKANDGALTRIVIDFKAELERIREQVQNIE